MSELNLDYLAGLMQSAARMIQDSNERYPSATSGRMDFILALNLASRRLKDIDLVFLGLWCMECEIMRHGSITGVCENQACISQGKPMGPIYTIVPKNDGPVVISGKMT